MPNRYVVARSDRRAAAVALARTGLEPAHLFAGTFAVAIGMVAVTLASL